MERITVTELMRTFREYIGRVANGGERWLPSRCGKIVAELRGAASGRTLEELPSVLESLPRLSPEEAEAFAGDLETARAQMAGTEEPRDPGRGGVRAGTRRSAFVEAVLERFPLLPVDLGTALARARVWADLAAAGRRWRVPRLSPSPSVHDPSPSSSCFPSLPEGRRFTA